jgi:hypothetical protein
MHAKVLVQVMDPFLSFMIHFFTCKVDNVFTMMLDLCYKGLGFIIQYVPEERAFQIASK